MNKKAQQYRNKNHLGAQTSANTENLGMLGKMVIPMSAKVFELEKTVERLQRQISEARAMASLAEYKASAIVELMAAGININATTVRERIVQLQVSDFLKQSAADDKNRGLVEVEGPAEKGQIAILSGKVFKDGVELENEEVIGSKITIGEDDLFQGIDEQIVGMNVCEIRKTTFVVNDQEYEFHAKLEGLRTLPAKTEETVSEETKSND